MIEYLKAKDHKGISKIMLNNLGHINVFCGKNNSGKTAILESLSTDGKHGLGKLVDSNDWLIELFAPECEKYSNPSPGTSKRWFEEFINGVINEKSIWYNDEKEEIVQQFVESMKNNPYLRGHNVSNLFNFDRILSNYFQKIEAFYKPILIPPKRRLESKVIINFKEAIEPNGNGVINKLFFLKNQDLESKEYRRYKEIYHSFNQIAGIPFNIVPNTDNTISLLFQQIDNWINANDCGLGLSDLLILITILFECNNGFVLIEEPENHLHAEMQKKLLNLLVSIKSKQFIISTHSSIFLDSYNVDRIFYVQNKNGITISDQTSKSKIINSLGYSVSDNLVADFIILTEGPTDIQVLKKIFNWAGIDSTYNIKFWPLGGDIMADLDLSVFAERKNVYALIDSDPGSKVIRTRFEKKCKEANIYCKRLKRYSIENYLSLTALRTVFNGRIPEELSTLKEDIKVDDQIGFSKIGQSIKGKIYEVLENMNLEEILETDLYQFALKVKKTVES